MKIKIQYFWGTSTFQYLPLAFNNGKKKKLVYQSHGFAFIVCIAATLQGNYITHDKSDESFPPYIVVEKYICY